jgi:hypothetical protein
MIGPFFEVPPDDTAIDAKNTADESIRVGRCFSNAENAACMVTGCACPRGVREAFVGPEGLDGVQSNALSEGVPLDDACSRKSRAGIHAEIVNGNYSKSSGTDRL